MKPAETATKAVKAGVARPVAKGVMLALAAATLFGVSTPLLQRAGTDVGPWMTAALLYAGAAAAGLALCSPATKEARPRPRHAFRLWLMALFGAVLGPAALAWGLQHTNGTSASLMLTFEAVFTAVLASLMYGEQMSGRVIAAMASLSAGGLLLVLDRWSGGPSQVSGLLAVAAATLCWAIDNALSRSLAHLDPGRVVLGKSMIGSVCSMMLAATAGQMTVPLIRGGLLILLGALAYGSSLHFYLLAQRAFGAARTGSVFGAAPFIGAFVAMALGERALTMWALTGACLMAFGVVLHATETHAHEHRHESVEHEHSHTPDDGHHDHHHDPMPVGAHSHKHRHLPISHAHPHAPDLHHRHSH